MTFTGNAAVIVLILIAIIASVLFIAGIRLVCELSGVENRLNRWLWRRITKKHGLFEGTEPPSEDEMEQIKLGNYPARFRIEEEEKV